MTEKLYFPYESEQVYLIVYLSSGIKKEYSQCYGVIENGTLAIISIHTQKQEGGINIDHVVEWENHGPRYVAPKRLPAEQKPLTRMVTPVRPPIQDAGETTVIPVVRAHATEPIPVQDSRSLVEQASSFFGRFKKSTKRRAVQQRENLRSRHAANQTSLLKALCLLLVIPFAWTMHH